MSNRRRSNARLRRLGGVLAATCVMLGAPALAQASTFTSSAISSPASGTVLFYDGDQGAGSVTVSGSVSPAAATTGRLLCYTSAATPYTVADSVAVPTSGKFTTTVSLSVIHGQACTLRLVPAGTTPSHSAASVFAGPVVSVSDQYTYSSGGVLYGYDMLAGEISWAYELGSLGECPIRASFSTDSGTLSSYYLLDGNSCLLQSSGIGLYEGTRSAIQIDDLNAYPPAAIHTLTSLGGFTPLSYSASWSADHTSVTVTETDALMYCAPPGNWPPTSSSCPSLMPSGVVVHQTTTLTDAGQLARVSQQFVDVDHKQHQLDLLFSQSVRSPAAGELPGFEFPGQSVFASHASPDRYALFPNGRPGTVWVIANAADAPADSNPIGAISYQQPPEEADFVSSSGAQTATFLMHYRKLLPANGSVTYNWSFAQAADTAALTPLVNGERDHFFTPKLKLVRPRGRTIVRNSPVTVSVIASDPIGIDWVSINGHAATRGRHGRFSARISLRRGVNRISVRTANLGGITADARTSIDYRPLPCTVPSLRGRTLAKARKSLIAHGCALGRVRRRFSRTVARGRVISSMPGYGRRRSHGAKVMLILSAGRR
jgi:hypothetical protein